MNSKPYGSVYPKPIMSPTDKQMRSAGWSETDGIGLWTNPEQPGILVDTNAIAVSVYNAAGQRLNAYEEETFLLEAGLPVRNAV